VQILLAARLQHTATHRNTPQHTATHTATHCNTLQCTATHCNTLQHIATTCNTPHNLFRKQALQDEQNVSLAATHCNADRNTLQQPATTRCNTLQNTATPFQKRAHQDERHVSSAARLVKKKNSQKSARYYIYYVK